MRYAPSFLINGRQIAIDAPTYFVADVASNHDGDIERAKALIRQAAEAGADAVKFQHFKARSIVSDVGFKDLGSQLSHQSSWKKSVYEVYQDCELDRSWNEILTDEAKAAKVDFMTTPYDVEAVNECAPLVAAFNRPQGSVFAAHLGDYRAFLLLPALFVRSEAAAYCRGVGPAVALPTFGGRVN